MGACCSCDNTQATDSNRTENVDDKKLLQDQNLKYNFIAEYGTTLDSTVDYQETVSRRHSVSISIAILNNYKNID